MSGLVEAHVSALAACCGHLPPVLVRRGDLSVVDGAHRLAAARRLGMSAVLVEWFEGTWVEALQSFLARNTSDGLAVSVDDRQRGVRRLLAGQPDWSDRRIAQICGVSPKMVARMRSNDEGPHSDSPCAKRIGRDGRARPVRAGVMRSRIAEALSRDPQASLRSIASQLGVSPETVRSVRMEREAPQQAGFRDAVVGAPDMSPVGCLVRQLPTEPLPPAWHQDMAFTSTRQGMSFVEWFDATDVAADCGRADDVPLSRVYDIADEARRRATFWSEFALTLEARTRRRRR